MWNDGYQANSNNILSLCRTWYWCPYSIKLKFKLHSMSKGGRTVLLYTCASVPTHIGTYIVMYIYNVHIYISE